MFASTGKTHRSTAARILPLAAALFGCVAYTLPLMGQMHVAIDQAGYRPLEPKRAIISQQADSFSVVDAATGAVLFKDATAWRSLGDQATGLTLWQGDFSAFQQPGRFRIVTSAGDSSEVFSVSDSVYDPVYRKALKGFYFQRCGVSLTAALAGVYQHGQCHIADAQFHSSTDTTGFRLVTGGWHDAGDYGKYVVNAGISVGTMLMAYELFPTRFSQDNIGIPESGNSVPDILDEARFELQWFLTMQRANGGVHFKVTKPQFESFVMPQSDMGTRYIYELSSTATADFAAVMARAARVYQPFDATFAQTCRSAAERAWSWLEAHPSIVPTGGFHNPTGTVTGEYGDGNDADERLWAAAELFVTTGEAKYNTTYTSSYSNGGIINGPMGWPNVAPMAHLTYLFSTQAGTNTTVQSAVRQSLITWCDNAVYRRGVSGFYVLLQPGEYVWGSNSGALNAAILLLAGYKQSQKASYREAAEDQLHYILGTNVHTMTFVTGVGARSPLHPHHRPSGSDGIAAPVPGLLVGGPDQYLNDASLAAAFTSSTPPARCYLDVQDSYASNEICINWNAPLVAVAGFFNGEPGTSSVKDERHGSLINEQIQLEQNYPNPFNGTTLLSFSLPHSSYVDLVISDQLGRTVDRVSLGFRRAGRQQIAWNAVDRQGSPLSSGVYFCYLLADQRSAVRKLLLLK